MAGTPKTKPAKPVPSSGGTPASPQPTPAAPPTPSTKPVRNTGGTGSSSSSAGSFVSSGAGFVLGLLVWTWVGLPFLQGGPTAVKNMLRAKFLNKAPDGSWLP